MLSFSVLLTAIAGLASQALAVNVLFVDSLEGREYQEATVTLGYNGENPAKCQNNESQID